MISSDNVRDLKTGTANNKTKLDCKKAAYDLLQKNVTEHDARLLKLDIIHNCSLRTRSDARV